MAWFDKIKTWLPDHFTGSRYNTYFQALAELLDDLQSNLNDTIRETYIGQANQPYPVSGRAKQNSYKDMTFLDIHGQERDLTRFSYDIKAEDDVDFQNRIRRIKYNRTLQNIKEEILRVVNVGVETTSYNRLSCKARFWLHKAGSEKKCLAKF